jgi:hypothetical protein
MDYIFINYLDCKDKKKKRIIQRIKAEIEKKTSSKSTITEKGVNNILKIKITSIATAIVTVLGATSCMGM